jgi:hypothetical protein
MGKVPNPGLHRMFYNTFGFDFYGIRMYNSCFYNYFSYLYLVIFIYFLITFNKTRDLFLDNKVKLMFFTRRVLVSIWKVETYIKFKNKIRSYILNNKINDVTSSKK